MISETDRRYAGQQDGQLKYGTVSDNPGRMACMYVTIKSTGKPWTIISCITPTAAYKGLTRNFQHSRVIFNEIRKAFEAI